MARLRERGRLRELRFSGFAPGIQTYKPVKLSTRGFKLVFYNLSMVKVGELGADTKFGKLSYIDFELLPSGCASFSFELDSIPDFEITYRTRVDVFPYFDPTPWFSGFIQIIPKPGQPPPFRYVGFGFIEQLNWVLITASYTNQELSLILKNILSNFIATNTQIVYDEAKIQSTTYTVNSISFDHTPAWDAIEQLANLVSGYVWGVDNERAFYFKQKDTGVNYHVVAGKHFENVEIEEDPLSIRNKLYVKSGKIQSDGTNIVGTVSDSESISTYGLREDVVTAPDVLSANDALAWAQQILTEKKVPKIKAKIKNIILDDTKSKIEASGKIRITTHGATVYELPINRVNYKISKDGVLAEIDCGQNPHPLEEILSSEKKVVGDEKRLTDKRTSELYKLIYNPPEWGTLRVNAYPSNNEGVFRYLTTLAFSVEANKLYGFRYYIRAVSAAGQGVIFAFDGPGTPVEFMATLKYWDTSGVIHSAAIFNYASNLNAPGAWSDRDIMIEGYLVNGSTAGMLQPKFKTYTPGQNVVIWRGSWGLWYKFK